MKADQLQSDTDWQSVDNFEAAFKWKSPDWQPVESIDDAFSWKPELTAERAVGAVKEGGKDVARNTLMSLGQILEKQANLIKGIEPEPEAPGFIGTLMPEAMQDIKAMQETAASNMLKTDPNFRLSSGFIEDVVRMTPQFASQVAASLVGGPVAGIGVMGLQIAGSTYEGLIEKGVSNDRALAAGLTNAMMQAPLEQLGISKGLKWLKVSKPLMQKLKGLVTVAGTEWLTEFTQAVPEAITNIWAENPDKDLAEKTELFIDNGMAMMKQGAYEGLVAATLSAATFGLGGAINVQQEQSALIPQQTIEQLEAQRQTVLSNIQEQYSSGALTTDDLLSIKKEPSIRNLGIDEALDELIIDSKSLEPMVEKPVDEEYSPEPPKQVETPPERPAPGGEAIELPLEKSINSSTVEDFSNTAISDSKALSDFVNTKTFQSKGLSGFDIPTQRVMVTRMFSILHDPKIKDAVIKSVPVDVMDYLRSQKLTPEEFFHDESMLINALAIDSDGSIFNIASSLIDTVASQATKIGFTNMARVSTENASAGLTNKRGVGTGALEGVGTLVGTKDTTGFTDSIQPSLDKSSTVDTMKNRHDITPVDIVSEKEGAAPTTAPSIPISSKKQKVKQKQLFSPAATGKAGLKRADIEIAKAKTLKDETGEGVAGESIAEELGIQYNGYWKDIDKQLWTDTTKGKESSFASKTLDIAEVKEQLAKTRKGYEEAAKPKPVEPRGAEEAGNPVEKLIEEIKSDIMPNNNLKRGNDYYATQYENFTIDQLKELREWTKTQNPYVDRRLGGNIQTDIMFREAKLKPTPKPVKAKPEGRVELATKKPPIIKFNVISVEQLNQYQKIADSIIPWLKRAGASSEVIDRITVDLKPLVDVNLDKAMKSVKNWVETGRSIDDIVAGIVGQTTVGNYHALIELAMVYNTPKSIEHTTYHEFFHVASKWILPAKDYAALEKQFGNEEVMAEAYADYLMKPETREKLPSLIRRIFLKLRQMFRAVGNGLKKQGVTKVEDIFGKLAAGKYEPHFKKDAVMPELAVKKPFDAKAFLEAIPEYNQFQEAMKDPSTKRVIDEAFDNMSYFKQRFGQQFKDKDMKLMKRIFTLPYWAGKEFKHIGKAVQIEIDLGEERSSIVFKDYNDTKLGEIQTTLPKNKVAFKQYNALTWKWDNKRFSKKDVPSDWHKEIVKGEDIETNPEHYEQVEALLTKQGYDPEAIEAFVEVRKLLDSKYVDLDKLMRIEKADPTLIEEFRAEFGKIHNYFPHRRTGDAYVQVIDSEGKVAYHTHYWKKSDRLFKSIDKKARSVAKQWAENKGLTEYRIKEGAVTSLPDDVYFHIPVEGMQQIASEAGRKLEEYRAEYEADRLVKKEGYTKEEALKVARKRLTADMEEALSKSMSDVFKVRGWGRHGIRRKNIPGHETEDTFGILYDYLNGYAGFKTKIKRAKAHSANLMDLNAKKNPQEYDYLSKYVKDVLANSDKIDRWVDGARALFFVKYLGFVPKSGMVNLTQNIILAAPLLSQYTKGSTFKLTKAMVDVRKSLISKNALMGKEVKYSGLPQVEQDALHDMIEGGTTMDLFLREVKGSIPGTGWGKYANKFIDKSGIFMMVAEKFNRASTGLAAFRIAYNEGATLKDGTSTKGDYEKAIRWAKKRVYDAHFLYGKANYPELMRGSVTGKIMRAGYTFRTFTHNYLLCMSNLLMKQGPAGKKAFARSLRNLFLMGGLTAIPFFKAMSEMLTWVLGDDDKDPLTVARGYMPYDWMRDIVTFGLPGVLGFDMTGSLSIEVPRNWKDIIGVPYAAWDDSVNMVKSLESGQIYRAISETPITPITARNAMRGLELYTKGQVSRSGKAINYLDQMGPKKITTKEMVGKSLLGLQPTSVSKGYKAYQATRKMQEAVQRKQSNWASQYVNALRANDKAKRDRILKEIDTWNKKAIKEGATHKIINIKGAVKARMQPGYKTIPKKMRKEALRISEQWR